ncbi:MAG: alpha-amylase family glycosyl hydrolase [bacterium]
MIILQSFYWNCLENWYQHLDVLVEEIAKKGFDQVWLPPPSAGMAGRDSMGYDIKEHYNLNSRFGTEDELRNLIDKFHENDVKVMADLVMGHMLGGDLDYNPLLNKKTYSLFNEKKFPKNYKHFCHNCGNCNSNNSFGETICYYSDNCYMKNGLIQWAKWLKKEIGFDSFRLDNLKDMRWEFIKDFVKEFEDTFMIGEYWDGSDEKLISLINKTGINLFDFPLYYKLREACMNPMFSFKEIETVSKYNKVNFLSNHDIDRSERDVNKDAIANRKELGYAYAFFQDNPIVVFWEDYFTYELKEEIDFLIKYRKRFEKHKLEIVNITDDIYHAKRGNYHLIINNSNENFIYNEAIIGAGSYQLFYHINTERRAA